MSDNHNPQLRQLLYKLVVDRMLAIQLEAKQLHEFDADEFALLYELFIQLAPPADKVKVKNALIENGLLVEPDTHFQA